MASASSNIMYEDSSDEEIKQTLPGVCRQKTPQEMKYDGVLYTEKDLLTTMSYQRPVVRRYNLDIKTKHDKCKSLTERDENESRGSNDNIRKHFTRRQNLAKLPERTIVTDRPITTQFKKEKIAEKAALPKEIVRSSLSDAKLLNENAPGEDHICDIKEKENYDAEDYYDRFKLLSDTDWLVGEQCSPDTVYIAPNKKQSEVHLAHVLNLQKVTIQQQKHLYQVFDTFERQLSGDYMLNIIDICRDGASLYVITDHCEGGTLTALLARARHYDEVLNEIEIQDWLVQLILALKYIHTHGIKHLNVNCNSILLKNNTVRLSEPSQLKWLYKRPDRAETVLCSDVIVCVESDEELAYTAPEVLTDQPVTEKADVWSVGCILYELCAQRRVFGARSRQQLFDAISAGCLPSWPDTAPAHLESVWRKMMSANPDDRPTLRQLLQEPCLAEHLEDMQASAQTPFPVVAMPAGCSSKPGSYLDKMPQLSSLEYDLDSDDENLQLTEEDTMKLLGLI